MHSDLWNSSLNRYYDNQFECDKKLVSEENV